MITWKQIERKLARINECLLRHPPYADRPVTAACVARLSTVIFWPASVIFGSMMTFVVGPWQIGAALILPKFASYDGREGIKLREIEEAERAEMTRVSEADF